MTTEPHVLRTTAGDLPLEEYHLRLEGHAWRILHTGAIVSHADEDDFLRGDHGDKPRLPYGMVLWPASIALAHALVSGDRAGNLRGKRVLELGAGTGLPGIVAATLGAQVVQTDRQEVALAVCRMNAERNAVTGVERRAADWTAWDDTTRYDVILASDVLYAVSLHAHLRRIFDTNLAPGGVLLVSDPFRKGSLELLEIMAGEGWQMTIDKWMIGDPAPRPVGVFALTRAQGASKQ